MCRLAINVFRNVYKPQFSEKLSPIISTYAVVSESVSSEMSLTATPNRETSIIFTIVTEDKP